MAGKRMRAKPAPSPRPTRSRKPVAAKKADVKPAAGKPMKPPKKGVTVRMYRTGLGDCFLLAFPRTKTAKDPRGAFYLLIDCGVFKATPNGADRIKAIAEDRGVAMPGFFVYMGWASLALLPLLALTSWLFL